MKESTLRKQLNENKHLALIEKARELTDKAEEIKLDLKDSE